MKVSATIENELREVRDLLEELIKTAPAKWNLPTEEFEIAGMRKLRRDLILCVLSSSNATKKRKQEIMDQINRHNARDWNFFIRNC